MQQCIHKLWFLRGWPSRCSWRRGGGGHSFVLHSFILSQEEPCCVRRPLTSGLCGFAQLLSDWEWCGWAKKSCSGQTWDARSETLARGNSVMNTWSELLSWGTTGAKYKTIQMNCPYKGYFFLKVWGKGYWVRITIFTNILLIDTHKAMLRDYAKGLHDITHNLMTKLCHTTLKCNIFFFKKWLVFFFEKYVLKLCHRSGGRRSEK